MYTVRNLYRILLIFYSLYIYIYSEYKYYKLYDKFNVSTKTLNKICTISA